MGVVTAADGGGRPSVTDEVVPALRRAGAPFGDLTGSPLRWVARRPELPGCRGQTLVAAQSLSGAVGHPRGERL
jgi:hypothetical protein